MTRGWECVAREWGGCGLGIRNCVAFFKVQKSQIIFHSSRDKDLAMSINFGRLSFGFFVGSSLSALLGMGLSFHPPCFCL